MEIKESSYKKGSYIFIMGDKPDYFYIIKEGKVKITFKAIPDVVYKKGEFFGEFSILTGSKREGTAIALQDTVLKKIDKKYFYDFLRMFPEVLYKIIKKYAFYIEKIDIYFGGETIKDSSILDLQPSDYSFKEGLEFFFDGKYEDAALIMEKVSNSNDDEKWQAKAYLALCYSRMGKDLGMCKNILNDVLLNAPTPAEKDLAQSIMDKLR